MNDYKYWQDRWSSVEKIRYSPWSKEAFETIKAICKYHMCGKSDGSIVSQIIMEDGSIVEDQEKVSAILIHVLKDIQFSEKFEQYTGTLPFPDLPPT